MPFTAAIPKAPTLNAERVRRWHATVAEVLQETSPDPDVVREAMWHLVGTEDPAAVGRYFASLLDQPAQEAAERALVERLTADGESGIAILQAALSEPTLSSAERYTLAGRMCHSLWVACKFRLPQANLLRLAEATRDYLRSAMQTEVEVVKKMGLLEHLVVLANANVHVGDALAGLGRVPAAAEAFEEARKLLEPIAASTVVETDASIVVVPTDHWPQLEKDLAEKGIAYSLHSTPRLAQQMLSLVFNRLGDLRQQTGVVGNERIALFRQAITATLGDGPGEDDLDDPDDLESLAVSLERLGDEAVERGEPKEAEALYQRRSRIAQRLVSLFPDRQKLQRDLSVAYRKQGLAATAQGKHAEAIDHYQRGLAVLDRLLKREPDHHLYLRDLAVMYIGLGQSSAHLEDVVPAHRYLQQAVDIRERLADLDPANVSLRSDLALALVHQAQAMPFGEEALPSWRRAVALLEGLLADQADNRDYRTTLAVACRGVGASLHAMKQWPEALYPILRGHNLVESLHADGKEVNDNAKTLHAELRKVVLPLHWFDLAGQPADALVDVLKALGYVSAAVESQGWPTDNFRLPLIEEALLILERLREQALLDVSPLISYIHNKLGEAAVRMNRLAAARGHFEQAVAGIEGWRRTRKADPAGIGRLADSLINLGRMLLTGPDADEGRRLLLRASEIWRQLLDHGPLTREVAVQLATVDYLSARPLALRDPEDPAIQELLGESHQILSELERAGYPLEELQLKALAVLRKAAGS